MAASLSPSQTLALLVLLLSFFTSHGLRIDLTHISANQNYSFSHLLQSAITRTKHRLSTLASGGAGGGEYAIDLSVGSPPQHFPAILDTRSDLTWTQCKPCKECFTQPTPIFDPSLSRTVSKLSCSSELCNSLDTHICSSSSYCNYYSSYSYSDDKLTHGVLSIDTFTISSSSKKSHSFPKLGFGCGYENTFHNPMHASGYVGLGRGRLSLISQLGFTKFSHCFNPLGGVTSNSKSLLLLGSEASLSMSSAEGRVQSTRLHRNPNNPSLYYLNMQGVTVGNSHLQIRRNLASEDYGDGALVIDSGTGITALDYKLYWPVVKAFESHTRLPVADGRSVGLDLCFLVPRDRRRMYLPLERMELPKLVFHFKGADMELPVGSYMSVFEDEGLVCLMLSGCSFESILGHFQQQNMHVLFDLEQERVSFVRVKCDEL